ncbi:MAG: hypothetical protein QM535_20175 [Limnohabitans sp.]|nr:hypothetical protein [Limnohabitans sp.]
MKNKPLLLLMFIFFGLSVKSQEYEKYDFKKRINYVMQDSLYEVFDIIVNKHPIGPKKYIEMDIVPLKFAIWDKEKERNPKFYSDDYIWHQKSDDNIKYHLYPFVNNINGSFLGDFTISPYKLLIKSEENKRGMYVDTYLNSFEIGISFDHNVDKTSLCKNFFCKTRVMSDWYINTDADFRIYNIFYYTTLSITSGSRNKNDKKRFDIIIYEKSDDANNLRVRKTIINGNNQEAIKYLRKNNIDYSENDFEQFKEEDFKPLK